MKDISENYKFLIYSKAYLSDADTKLYLKDDDLVKTIVKQINHLFTH